MGARDRILVAGGGPAGLATALALTRAGCAGVRVFEQTVASAGDEPPGDGVGGYGIQLGPNAVRALESLGVGEALGRVAFRPEGVELRDGASGRLMASLPLGESAERRYGAPYYQVRRRDLVTIMERALERMAPEAMRRGVRVVGARREADGVGLSFADGNEATGGVLVGADGMGSVVGRTVFGHGGVRFAGWAAWRGLVLASDFPEAGERIRGAVVWMGGERHLVAYPVEGGRVINIVGIVAQRGAWRERAVRAGGARGGLADAFAGFAPWVVRLAGAADHCGVWGIFTRSVGRRWVRGRVALVGEAACPVLPFLAQGAAMGIEDGCALAARGLDNPERALGEYFRARRHRVLRVRRASWRNGVMFHLPSFPAAVVWGGMRLALGAGFDPFGWLYRGARELGGGRTP